MTPLELMRHARELISDEANWTTRAIARDANGVSQPAWSSNATCWCLAGAICKFDTERSTRGDVRKILNDVIVDYFDANIQIEEFNDSRKHAEVLELLDRAIQYAQWDAEAMGHL